MKKNKILIIGILVFLISSIIIISLPVLLTKNSVISLEVDSPNEIGDTLGGIMGPFIGLLAAFLTFLAFWVQYQANQKVQEQFQKQELSNKLYYYHELLNKAREKINIYKITINGNDQFSFNGLLNEFKIILNTVIELDKIFHSLESKNKLPSTDTIEDDFEDISFTKLDEIIRISWHICFNGLKYNERNFFEKIIIIIHDKLNYKILKIDKKEYSSLSDDDYYNYRTVYKHIRNVIQQDENLSYYFNRLYLDVKINQIEIKGNFNVLSPYFQLYYQAIKLLNDSKILDYKEKYEFAKMYRAEMTKDEIYVFFINSLSDYGQEWEMKIRGDKNDIRKMDEKSANKCLITKYNILKHISDVPEIYINVKKLYPDLIFSSDTDSERDVKKAYRSSIFK